jgi:O-antigen ligase
MAVDTLAAPAPLASRAGPRVRARRRRLPEGWAIYALFYGYPVWYLLGLQAFIWPIIALPITFHLIRRRRLVVPRSFGVYLLFLAWMLVSSLQLSSGKQILSFCYRGALYLSAAVLLVYVMNLDPRRFPTRRLAHALTFFWFLVVLGGFLALLLPHVRFTSPFGLLLPNALLRNQFIASLVQLNFADPSTLLGYAIARPVVPFNYTNEWGANLAIVTPFAIYGLRFVRHIAWRLAIIATLVMSLAPIILSINRGLWISLAVGILYVAGRLAARGNVKIFAATLAVIVVGAAGVVFTPLGHVVLDRVAHPNTEGRAYLYEQATESALASPIVGHGAPLPSQETGIALGASVGTHGQLWTILVSQGFPGVLLFLGFFLLAFFATWRVTAWGLWAHAPILIALSQFVVYNWLPVQIHLVVMAIALSWRDAAARAEAGRPAVLAPRRAVSMAAALPASARGKR